MDTEQRGSTLLLVVVLIAVLSIIGVAAVSLGSQERVNAAAKGKRDALAACANAARMALWAEIAKYGSGYLTSTNPVGEIVLADGTRLAAPAHYASAGTDALPVVQIVQSHSIVRSFAAKTVDLTNRMDAPQSQLGGTAYTVVARCRDEKGRENEVEFTTVLAL
jgi:type II secretory pathway pseudopilin PulG